MYALRVADGCRIVIGMLASPYVVVLPGGELEVGWPEGRGMPARTALARSGLWPCWNPRRDQIAYSLLDLGGSTAKSSVELVDLGGNHVRTLHETPQGALPVIAPRVPHYLSWSPGGDLLAVVGQSNFGLTLFLSEVDGILASDPVINGAPLFLAWCTDNNFLAVHAGPELAVVETQGSRTTAAVANPALGFRTPAYSDDAEILAYATAAEGRALIHRARFQGTGGRPVRAFPGGTALQFRPHTEHLSIALAKTPDSGVFDELWLMDLGDEAAPAGVLARGPFVAAWWAPDGETVALLVPLQTGDGRYQVQVRSAGGAFLAATEGFLPSEDFRLMASFFDQYATSHHPWSPGSDALLLCGRMAGDAPAPSFSDPAGDVLYLWEATPGARLERLGRGTSGFFPPATRHVYD